MATIGREAARAPLTSADINDGIVGAQDLQATLDLSSKTVTLPALSSLSVTGDLTVDTNTLFVDASANNVGIGTTSPSAKLHVVSGGSPADLELKFDTGSGATSSNFVDFNHSRSSGNFTFSFAGTERMRIDSSGNVGIGTGSTALSEALTVHRSGSASSFLQFTNGNTGQADNNGLYVGISASGTAYIGLRDTNNRDLAFQTNNTEVARIDSNGRLGIGTASPAKPLHVSQGANATATAIRIENTDTSITTAQEANTIEFYTNDASASGTGVSAKIAQVAENVGNRYSLAFSTYNTSLAEAMRIDDNNNLMVGTTSALFDATNRATIEVNGASNSLIALSDESSGSKAFKFYLYNDSGNSYITNFAADGYSHLWWTQGSEKMRLDTNGDLKIGTTSITSNDGIQLYGSGQIYSHVAGTSATDHVRFYRNSTLVGKISTSSAGTSYNSGSDARLKENIADAEDAGATVDAIQVRQFDWIADGSHQRYGMVAQELLEVAPEAVSGDPDSDDMMGVDYSKLVPMLVKEIQSLRARVAQLEGA